jgi:hypothetical protein
MNADQRFAQRTQRFEAGITKLEAELIFAFCMEGAATFATSGVRGSLALFPVVNFWMDFEHLHILSPLEKGARDRPDWDNSLDCKEKT